jgi:uncharacterized protein with HEPN domain
MKHRDEIILDKIVEYCDKIENALKRYQYSYEKFNEDDIFYSSCCMYILQIGELVSKLSDEFKAEHNEIPWKSIKDMRNIVAHAYGDLDPEITWNTLVESIPELKSYCLNIVDKN